MTKLKEQALEMLLNVPDNKMIYVIDILKGLNRLLNDKNMCVDNISASVPEISPEAFEAWEGFKKYKGIINCNIDEKAGLAKAREEKYANFA